MRYFNEYKDLKLEDLEQKGIYPNKLINDLKLGKFESILEYLNKKERTDREYMEPILYAVRNDVSTYRTYKYFEPELQKETLDIAETIAKEEPRVIEGTSLCNTEEFIKVVEANPAVADYASEELKNNPNYRYELAELINENNIKNFSIATLIYSNEELASNSLFMIDEISKDVNSIKYASEELRNDAKFMEEACRSNWETISYVANNTDDFGEIALETTKEVLVETSNQNAIQEFKHEEEILKVDIEQETDEEELMKKKNRERSIQNHQKFLEKLKNGELDPVRAARLMKIICKDLDEEYKQQIEELLKINDAIVDRKKEKENIREANEEQTITEINDVTKELKKHVLEKDDKVIDGGKEYGGER